MKYTDFDAIKRAYPTVVSIDETHGCFDKDNNTVTVEQSNIDSARTTLNTEAAAVAYKQKRAAAYPSIADQLDMQYWDKKNGTTTWVDAVAKVKSDNPKP